MEEIQIFLVVNFKNVFQLFALISRITCFSATVMALISAATADEMPQSWKIYTNAHYQYQICYPDVLLKPRPETVNGDGRRFLSDHGVELTVFAYETGDDSTLTDNVETEAMDLAGHSAKVTYQVIRNNWAMISGHDGKENLFYSKILEKDNRYVIFNLKYPKKESAVYDKVAATLSNCLKIW